MEAKRARPARQKPDGPLREAQDVVDAIIYVALAGRAVGKQERSSTWGDGRRLIDETRSSA